MALFFDRRSITGICALLVGLTCTGMPTPAAAWGDEGHRVVAPLANPLLDPAMRTKIEAMLAADTDTLTAHDIARRRDLGGGVQGLGPERGRNSATSKPGNGISWISN